MLKQNRISALLGVLLLAVVTGCATPRTGHTPPVVIKPSEKPVAPAIEAVKPVPVQMERPAAIQPPASVSQPDSTPAAPALPRDTLIAMQAALERANYSPGCITGVEDDFTHRALLAWQAARGLPVTGLIDDATLRRLGNTDAYFTTHTVTDTELGSLMVVPSTWLGRSALDRLGYQTLLELVAEKYHSTEQLIQDLNPGVAFPNPPAGTILRVPNPTPARSAAVKKIEILMSRNELKGYDEKGNQVMQFPVSIAKEVAKRPVGELTIINAAQPPNFTVDPEVFTDDEEVQQLGRKLLIHPGPNNPVGLGWLGLSKTGYGIHGTAWPEDIGKTQSHGCFRLANWNITKLMKMVTVGATVVVKD